MILCFSGTKNSQLAALSLASRLGDRLVMMDAETLTSPGQLDSGERLVWVCPVHSWGLPKAVRRYMRAVQIPGAESANHFLVVTCGDDCGLTASMWRSEMRRRQWKTLGAHSVFMPNTYVTLPGFNVDTPEVAARKMEAMPARIDEIGHAIKCSSPIDSIYRGTLPWLKTRVIYPLFMALLTSPRPFRSHDCISCGRCVKACPLGNVTLSNEGTPAWGRHCTLCLACYHVCPRHSIEYGNSTRRKGQWQGSFHKI